MRPQIKFDPQKEYRQQEKARIGAAPAIAQQFKELTALEVDLQYFEPDSLRRVGNLKYTVNLAHAKAAFSFHCPNNQCVGGDFDLSQELANAVEGRCKVTSGELSCQGWAHKKQIDDVRCQHVLRFAFHLRY